MAALAGAADAGLVPRFQAPDVTERTIVVRHGWSAQSTIEPRRVRLALALLFSQAGGARHRLVLGHGRGGLQMQLDLAGHADPRQIAFRDAPLLADAAPAPRERSSPAHQRDFMFRADRIHGTFHAHKSGILRSVCQKPFSKAIYSNRFCWSIGSGLLTAFQGPPAVLRLYRSAPARQRITLRLYLADREYPLCSETELWDYP